MANADSKVFGSSLGSSTPGTVACQTLSATGGAVLSGGIVTTSIVASGSVAAGSINAPVAAARAGIATITAGQTRVIVPLAGISNTSVVLATMHVDNGGTPDATATSVDYVETAVGQIQIYANAAATTGAEVSWYWVA